MNKERNGATYKGKKPDYPAPVKRNQGRQVHSKEIANADVAKEIKLTFDQLAAELKEAGYELIIRRPPAKDLVQFDFGLLFEKDTNAVQIYVDDDLREVINFLLTTNKQVLIKTNWLSPDVVALKIPLDDTAEESPTIAQNGSESTEEVETT